MKVVGNCPCCGNPIYGKRKSAGRVVQEPLRTCFCVPLNAKPLRQLTKTQVPIPFSVNYPTNTAAAGITMTSATVNQRPPDEDGALVNA